MNWELKFIEERNFRSNFSSSNINPLLIFLETLQGTPKKGQIISRLLEVGKKKPNMLVCVVHFKKLKELS
jgi:hypothetical protein